ncbi:hypothetical protein Tco_1012980 [Tanacetum coccineum]
MSTSTHPIIVPSDSDVEDAFSSTNTPDYTSASPGYSPASPGNTSSDPLEDSPKDRSASLTILPFHNNPYMKVTQAYNVTNFFLPEDILPPWKRACFLSSSSTDSSAPPYVFEIGESSYVTRLERHEEQIENILNHLDELDSWNSIYLYSNPNTDPNRMPLTKAKGQIPQKDKIHKIESMIKRFRKRYSRVVCPNEAAIEGNPGLMRN